IGNQQNTGAILEEFRRLIVRPAFMRQNIFIGACFEIEAAEVLNRQGWNDLVLIGRDGAVLKQLEMPVVGVVASIAWTPDGMS
ncbi:hypothetical protein F9L03_26340, partial [Brucella lupini]